MSWVDDKSYARAEQALARAKAADDGGLAAEADDLYFVALEEYKLVVSADTNPVRQQKVAAIGDAAFQRIVALRARAEAERVAAVAAAAARGLQVAQDAMAGRYPTPPASAGGGAGARRLPVNTVYYHPALTAMAAGARAEAAGDAAGARAAYDAAVEAFSRGIAADAWPDRAAAHVAYRDQVVAHAGRLRERAAAPPAPPAAAAPAAAAPAAAPAAPAAASPATAALLARARDYAAWDPNPETRAAHAGAAAWPADELTRAFGSRLEFGTAGLRAAMGPGSARMNEVTVGAAAQGLVAALLAAVPDAASRGIVVGFDHRALGGLSSRRFALLTAAAARARGVAVFLFGDLVATPLVPFAVLRLRAAAGVMVTASHNPARDNGYKVYWGNGAQITAPLDADIAAAIAANEAPWDAPAYAAALDGGAGEAALRARVEDPTAALVPAYLAAIAGALVRAPPPGAPDVRVTYTPLHGVGAPFAAAAFAAFGLPPFLPTPSQMAPDAAFPTVAFPNPEEAGALDAACAAADAAGATLVVANDPDADRLALAEWTAAGADARAWAPRAAGARGTWRVFTGNEVGAILAAACWEAHAARGGRPADAFMAASTVSSAFLGAMAAAEGFEYAECLTGFKHMGNAMAAAEARGKTPVFSFEEALGFCCGAVVRDKDGVSAAAVAVQAARAHAAAGRSLGGALAAAHARWGARAQNNGYVAAAPPQQAAIFARLANEGHYWARLGRLAVTRVRDLQRPGYDSGEPSRAPRLPTSSAPMITLTFCNGVVATLRGSGTEPKLKWYAEGSTAADVDETVALLVAEVIQPARHGLAAPRPLAR